MGRDREEGSLKRRERFEASGGMITDNYGYYEPFAGDEITEEILNELHGDLAMSEFQHDILLEKLSELVKGKK